MEIDISLIGAAHRTQYWIEFYQSIKTNLKFEIIFVSDKHKDRILPPEFKWIYSTVKPSQCYEIALREAKGEVVNITSDDTTYNPYCFDEAYKIYKANDYKTMVGFQWYEGWGELGNTTKLHHLFWRTSYGKEAGFWNKKPGLCKNTPMVMVCGLMSRQFIEELGRLDRRFICSQGDTDLQLRAYIAGSKLIFSEKSIAYNDISKHGTENNFRGPMGDFDNRIIASLYVKNKKITGIRSGPVEPYEDKDLLTISQSNKGLKDGIKWI